MQQGAFMFSPGENTPSILSVEASLPLPASSGWCCTSLYLASLARRGPDQGWEWYSSLLSPGWELWDHWFGDGAIF